MMGRHPGLPALPLAVGMACSGLVRHRSAWFGPLVKMILLVCPMADAPGAMPVLECSVTPFVRIVEVRNEAFRADRPVGRHRWRRFPLSQAGQAGRLSRVSRSRGARSRLRARLGRSSEHLPLTAGNRGPRSALRYPSKGRRRPATDPGCSAGPVEKAAVVLSTN